MQGYIHTCKEECFSSAINTMQVSVFYNSFLKSSLNLIISYVFLINWSKVIWRSWRWCFLNMLSCYPELLQKRWSTVVFTARPRMDCSLTAKISPKFLNCHCRGCWWWCFLEGETSKHKNSLFSWTAVVICELDSGQCFLCSESLMFNFYKSFSFLFLVGDIVCFFHG